MKICLLTTSFPRYKGDFAGNFLLDQSKELKKQGIRISIIAPHSDGFPREEEISGIKIKRFVYMVPFKLQRVAYSGGIVGNLKKIGAILELPLFLAAFIISGIRMAKEVDIFHAQWAQTAIIARLIKFFSGKKYLVTVLGSDVDVFARVGILKVLTEWGLRDAEWVIAGNEYLETRLKKLSIDKRKIVKINMGVGGIEEFLQIKENYDSKKFLFLGRISPEKNLRLVIESVSQINKNIEFQLVVIGDGPEKEEMENLVNRLDLIGKVEFLGSKPREKVLEIFEEVGFLVLPQKRGGFGIAVLEAMAASRPPILGNIPGVDEIIKDGYNGLLVPTSNSERLTEAIESLLVDKNLRSQLAKNAKALASLFTWEKHCRLLVGFYSEVVK
ncbi:MAG: glycosyltransferase family 4 protein [Candidatus Woykebacteria bacterium]